MVRIASASFLAAAVLALASAVPANGDGCPPLTCGTFASAQPGGSLLVVRSNGMRGPLTAYSARTGRERFSLPAGGVAADGRTFVSAFSRKPATRVTVYDARTGTNRTSMRVGGIWALAGVSATGRFAAFTGRAARRRHTALRVVDVARRRVAWTTSLRGSYDVETVSRDGQRLFLVHYRKQGYDLELYDRRTRTLRGNPDPEARGFMTGIPWTAIASRNGRWLLTVYVRSDGHVFVHALDVRTGRPRCIDLPSHGSRGSHDPASLGAAALALSPDERALYVANPLLGRVWTVDLGRSRVARTARFRPLPITRFVFGIGPVAAVSPSGRTSCWAPAGRCGATTPCAAASARRSRCRPSPAATRRPRACARSRSTPAVHTCSCCEPALVRGRSSGGANRGLDGGSNGPEPLALERCRGGDRERWSDQTALCDRPRAGGGRGLRRGREQRAPDRTGAGAQHLFLVRPLGPAGPLHAYDMPSARERFRLPAGLASPNGDGFYAAHMHPGRTHVVAYDSRSGVPRRTFNVPGRGQLAAVSPTGRWLVLARRARGVTQLRVVEATTGRVASRLALPGRFEVETVSVDGSKMFLVEHLADGAYRIRLYDLAAEALASGAVRAKDSDEIMAGYAWGGVATPDGRWLLTPYLSTRRDVAFVHTLNLDESFALCLDLPSGDGDEAALRAYGVALSPDGSKLYAANPALGVLAELDLASGPVVRTIAEFAPSAASRRTQLVVAEDGRSVFFSNGRAVWRHRVGGATVERAYENRTEIAGLGVSREGTRLFVAPVGGRPVAVAA